MAKLNDVLASLADADDALDAAEASLSEVLGIADPDTDDGAAQANSGRPLGLALAVARRLGV